MRKSNVSYRLGAAAVGSIERRQVSDGGRPLPSANASIVDLLGDAQLVVEFNA